MYLKQKQQNKPILTYANKQNKVLTDTYPNIECVCVFCISLCVCVHGSYQCQFQGEFLRKSYGTHSQILKDNVMYFLSLPLSLLVFLIDTLTLRVLIVVLELKLLLLIEC